MKGKKMLADCKTYHHGSNKWKWQRVNYFFYGIARITAPSYSRFWLDANFEQIPVRTAAVREKNTDLFRAPASPFSSQKVLRSYCILVVL